jgi:hypothetical protein
MSGGGRRLEEDVHVVDRALGVSRRRRRMAYLAIGGGLALLRPVLRRAAVTAAFLGMLVALAVYL